MAIIKDISQLRNQILCGDTIKTLRVIPDNSVDLIFADPPYNLQLRDELWRPNQTKVDAVNDAWDRFESFDEYDQFSKQWLVECRRVLKEDGVIWVIGSYHNIFRIGKIMQDLGFWIINDIIWIKSNPMPNFRGTRFTNAHETMIFAVKNRDSHYTFHYKSMKAYNDGVQMRSDWDIPICSGEERIRINGQKVHSTQKPEELMRRIIISTSNPGDLILDPFMGSGTTGSVAKLLGRDFIGIERDENYTRVAQERISKVRTLDEDLLDYPLEKRDPRVPFGSLLASGLIYDGETLYSRDRKFHARVLSNATIVSGDAAGSIHQVSALLQGKPNFNGWNFWYVERDGTMVSVDDLRSLFIKKNYQNIGADV
ncbi:DNA methyltransferase [Oxyplasma meridianum]|uniref:Type II methyltransferase n=1 Tax=Oxyplasma meridianum TaxID=3073602 RepID=A0AAX4NG56_9ARCH